MLHAGLIKTRSSALTLLFALLATANACDSGDEPAGDADLSLPDAVPGGLPPLGLPPVDPEETEMLPGSIFINIGADAKVTIDNKEFNFKGYTNTVWNAQESIPQTAQVGGCGLLVSSDGKVISSASFHSYYNKSENLSFSFADNGTSTVVWGLFDFATGEEWSSNGAAPQITTAKAGEFSYVYFSYEGEATENFSSAKAAATSLVTCSYIEI